MASIDPRKSESITNQPNYLMTVTTTALISLLTASVSSGIWNVTGYIVVGALWTIAFTAQEIRKFVRLYTRDSSGTRREEL